MALNDHDLSPQGESLQTQRMTVAQAIVSYLANQFIEVDGARQRVCAGGFGIFGHGNAPSLGEALYAARAELPLYRGQNEQSMGFAAAACAKAQLRRRFMFCTASAGRGTANLLTAAALADANRVITMQVDPHDGWTEQGHIWWEVGTAEVSSRAEVGPARAKVEAGRGKQRTGL